MAWEKNKKVDIDSPYIKAIFLLVFFMLIAVFFFLIWRLNTEVGSEVIYPAPISASRKHIQKRVGTIEITQEDLKRVYPEGASGEQNKGIIAIPKEDADGIKKNENAPATIEIN